MHIPNLQLCKFSKSEILDENILSACPLGLNSNQAKSCPCRKRLYHVTQWDLRVLSCTFPETWKGEEIRNPEALAKSIKAKSKTTTSNQRGETNQ